MIKQKEIYLAKLNPVVGREQGGVRPVVVVSGSMVNENLDLCIVCPITSIVKDFFTCVVVRKSALNCLDKDSEVLTFQIKAVSKSRLLKKMGEVSDEEFRNIFNGLKCIFSY
jgi:mRNA interferase MazF